MFKTKLTVTSAEVGLRIDRLCAQKYPEISRSQWTKSGDFICNGNISKSSKKTKLGDVWEIICEEEVMITDSDYLKPWDTPLKILKESKSWVVVEKPIGVSVHPSITEKSNETLVNALVHHFGKNLSENIDEIEGRKVARPGIVHRLDKPTSGALLVAKTNQAHKFFQDHWKETQKYYYAVVNGSPPRRGRIEAGIIRDPNNRQRMMVSDSDEAKNAITLFEKVKFDGGRSLLKIELLTGRTHQIRVHLSSIGFPIIGDNLYGGYKADRIYLHAYSLEFPDFDNDQKRIEVSSPLPKQFFDK